MNRRSAEVTAPSASRETVGLLLGGLGVVIFGGTLPFTRLAVEGLDPWFVTAGRAALAGLLAGLILLALRRKPPGRAIWPALAAVSIPWWPAFRASQGSP